MAGWTAIPADLRAEVVVIGGGATGAGVLRDLALRGIDALLVERGELASGTTGRSHGLLHSGGRYCVTDPATAVECAEEARILRRIAGHVIVDTGGYFVSVDDEDRQWHSRLIEGCRACGIPFQEVDVADARRREPALSNRIQSVLAIPGDGVIDGAGLVAANVAAAAEQGARILTQHEVVDFFREGVALRGVRVKKPGSPMRTIDCTWVVNAAGPWSGQIARLAGLGVRISPVRGVMAVVRPRLTNRVINRCHSPSDGDIVVPGADAVVLGTTASPVDDPQDTHVDPAELAQLLKEAGEMIDGVTLAGVARVYAGVRPVYDPGAADPRRVASRDFSVIDHAGDGIAGFTTVVGGKLSTYRRMAERAVDLVAERLGVSTPCSTAMVPLKPVS